MTKAVLFDFDGTLFFGTGELNDWCFARALEAMGRPAPTQDILDQTVGMTPIDISRLVLQSDDPALVAEFMDRVYALVPEYIARYVRPSAAAPAAPHHRRRGGGAHIAGGVLRHHGREPGQ